MSVLSREELRAAVAGDPPLVEGIDAEVQIQANGIDLSRSCVRSPLASWIRIPLGSAFASMAAHERRHLWQARKITEMAGFPAAT